MFIVIRRHRLGATNTDGQARKDRSGEEASLEIQESPFIRIEKIASHITGAFQVGSAKKSTLG
jgi:hypothetical protein